MGETGKKQGKTSSAERESKHESAKDANHLTYEGLLIVLQGIYGGSAFTMEWGVQMKGASSTYMSPVESILQFVVLGWVKPRLLEP